MNFFPSFHVGMKFCGRAVATCLSAVHKIAWVVDLQMLAKARDSSLEVEASEDLPMPYKVPHTVLDIACRGYYGLLFCRLMEFEAIFSAGSSLVLREGFPADPSPEFC